MTLHRKEVKKIMADLKGVHEEMPKKGDKVWMLCLKQVYYHYEEPEKKGSYWEDIPTGEQMVLGWSPDDNKYFLDNLANDSQNLANGQKIVANQKGKSANE